MSAGTSYTADEDALVIKLVAENMEVSAVARVLNRSSSSVSVRIHRLRSEKLMPMRRDFAGGRPKEDQPVTLAPPITLNGDDRVVSQCLFEGGFPRAMSLAGRTFWIKPDGTQWAHTPLRTRRAAA